MKSCRRTDVSEEEEGVKDKEDRLSAALLFFTSRSCSTAKDIRFLIVMYIARGELRGTAPRIRAAVVPTQRKYPIRMVKESRTGPIYALCSLSR